MEPRYNILQLIICCLIALMLGLGLMSFVVYWDQPKKQPELVEIGYNNIDIQYGTIVIDDKGKWIIRVEKDK